MNRTIPAFKLNRSMSTLAPPPELPPFPVQRFSVEEYHRLIDAEVLPEDARVELLEGWISPKMTHKPLHDATIQIIRKRIQRVLPEDWDIRIQSAITTTDSEPEPDLAIVRGDERRYLKRHPGPKDIGLLIEVAESSLELDREQKGRLYARARVASYWIVNVIDRQVEVFSEATGSAAAKYRACQICDGRDFVPLLLDGSTIAQIPARELLP